MDSNSDRPRFIGRTYGYVDSANVAADSLEAVSAEYQRELTSRAHRDWARNQQRRWGLAATKIGDAIEEFVGRGVDPRLRSDLRLIQRGVRRVERRVADELRRAGGV